MHYRNGREAHNGDKIMVVSNYPQYRPPVVGILYDAVAGNDHCNGRLARIDSTDPMPDLSECLHLDDALALLAEPTPVTDPNAGA